MDNHGMKLEFTGFNKASQVSTSAKEIEKQSDSTEKNGYFVHNGEWTYNDHDELLSVTFKPTIYINSELDKATKEGVKVHEERHYDDFKARAIALRSALQAVVKRKVDPQMEERWEWFVYDVHWDAEIFHRKEGRMSRFLLEPSSERPK
jgi:hypothetical protein